MHRLMNSAMMPLEGSYIHVRITKDEFCLLVDEAVLMDDLVCYIGYQENLDLIYRWTGVLLTPSREQTVVKDGDFLLIMKLKYRVHGQKRGHKPCEKDFEFFLTKYGK